MLPFACQHEILRSSALLAVALSVIQLLQFSGSAEDVASFGQNSVTLETTQDGKTPIAQTESLGEHQNWAIHFDAVEVFQGQPGFHSPYRGAQSLYSDDDFRQTSEADLFLAGRIWPGGEIYFNLEYYQGFGFGETHGLAAFPNAQAYKTGQFRGDVNIPRIFFRQVWGFGGEQEKLDADELQLAEKVDISRLTLQVGRFSVTDVFDNNAYAHDSRGDFLNWAASRRFSFRLRGGRPRLRRGFITGVKPKNLGRALGYLHHSAHSKCEWNRRPVSSGLATGGRTGGAVQLWRSSRESATPRLSRERSDG